jgi:hypothetical protein
MLAILFHALLGGWILTPIYSRSARCLQNRVSLLA